ncbi:AraC family ligand binding domain-containing protein, partial [Pseudomonas viridiflava]
MKRQPPAVSLFRTSQAIKARGVEVELHQHEEAQLMYASSGTLQIHTRSGCWLVPPQLAVWVPAHVLHKIDVLSDVH